MTTGEKTEAALIPVAGIAVWMLSPHLPHKVGVGTLLLWASALLLFQSLVRDLWLLRKAKQDVTSAPARKLRCMCVESTAGVTGVAIGLLFLGTGMDKPVVMDRWIWSLVVMITLATGFLIKEFVVEWNPWRIRRDKDHLNIVVTWKA